MVTEPGTSSGSATPSDGELPSDGAPKVRDPLGTGRFQQNPCLSLTEAQLKQLNVSQEGGVFEAPLGKACRWRNVEAGGSVELQFFDRDPRGLSASYKANNAHKYEYFTKLPEIEGYPAVALDVVDGRGSGRCNVVVGASDKIAFYIALALSSANVGKKDSCETAAQVAGMAVKTMKAGG